MKKISKYPSKENTSRSSRKSSGIKLKVQHFSKQLNTIKQSTSKKLIPRKSLEPIQDYFHNPIISSAQRKKSIRKISKFELGKVKDLETELKAKIQKIQQLIYLNNLYKQNEIKLIRIVKQYKEKNQNLEKQILNKNQQFSKNKVSILQSKIQQLERQIKAKETLILTYEQKIDSLKRKINIMGRKNQSTKPSITETDFQVGSQYYSQYDICDQTTSIHIEKVNIDERIQRIMADLNQLEQQNILLLDFLDKQEKINQGLKAQIYNLQDKIKKMKTFSPLSFAYSLDDKDPKNDMQQSTRTQNIQQHKQACIFNARSIDTLFYKLKYHLMKTNYDYKHLLQKLSEHCQIGKQLVAFPFNLTQKQAEQLSLYIKGIPQSKIKDFLPKIIPDYENITPNQLQQLRADISKKLKLEKNQIKIIQEQNEQYIHRKRLKQLLKKLGLTKRQCEVVNLIAYEKLGQIRTVNLKTLFNLLIDS